MRLLEFDGNGEIPYPLRSVHPLAEVEPGGEISEAVAEAAAKARRIAESGCYGAAADRYAAAASKATGHAGLRMNVGLCRAWDADHGAASGALTKAAAKESDFEVAAELEAIGQLLTIAEEGGSIDLKERVYVVPSVSGLLSDLDDRPRFHRLTVTPEPDGPPPPTAVYELLDREMPTALDGATAADVPNVVGELSIFDSRGAGGEQDGPRAVLSAFFGSELDAAEELVGDTALTLAPEAEQLDDAGGYGLPEELWGLRWRWAFPEGTALAAAANWRRPSGLAASTRSGRPPRWRPSAVRPPRTSRNPTVSPRRWPALSMCSTPSATGESTSST